MGRHGRTSGLRFKKTVGGGALNGAEEPFLAADGKQVAKAGISTNERSKPKKDLRVRHIWRNENQIVMSK